MIIQPATPNEVAPLVALAYGLSERECQVTRLFDKTGVRSRGELVGQVFLQHYVPRWEQLAGAPAGWMAQAAPE